MFTTDKLYIIEYNMRPGDPEGQILSSHLDCDFLSLLYDIALGKNKIISIKYKKNTTACIAIANVNYLNNTYLLEGEIQNQTTSIINLEKIKDNINIFLDSSISYKDNSNTIFTDEPKRIINLCTTSHNPFEDIYNQLNSINAENIYYRTDIKAKI